jgi:hypothetical protein
MNTTKSTNLFYAVVLNFTFFTLTGCLTNLGSGGPSYDQQQTSLQQLHSILDIKNPAQRNAAALEGFRNALSQSDAMLSAAGMDPASVAYETHYHNATERGAQPTEADWEAQKVMRDMEIFKDGGMPTNF